MNITTARNIIGKRVLLKMHSSTLCECVIDEIDPSGNAININGGQWESLSEVELVSILSDNTLGESSDGGEQLING